MNPSGQHEPQLHFQADDDTRTYTFEGSNPSSAMTYRLPRLSLLSEASVNFTVFAKTVCDGCGGFKWIWVTKPPCGQDCFSLHEVDHIMWFEGNRPEACKDKPDNANPHFEPGDRESTECSAYNASKGCVQTEYLKAKSGRTSECRTFLRANLQTHKNQIKKYCGNK